MTNNTDGAALLPVTPSDEEIAAAARQSLGEWLAWPDAGRDGPREVTNEQVKSWLSGLPNRLASLTNEAARHRIATQEDAERSGAGDEGRAARIQKYLVDQAGSRERLMTFPPAVSERLRRWQEGQSEWFSSTVLEIVAEFITFDDALSTPQRQEYDGEAVREAFEAGWIASYAGKAYDDALSEHVAALAHPAQATPSASPKNEPVALAKGFQAEEDVDTFTIRFPDGHAITAWASGRLVVTKAETGFQPFAIDVSALTPSAVSTKALRHKISRAIDHIEEYTGMLYSEKIDTILAALPSHQGAAATEKGDSNEKDD